MKIELKLNTENASEEIVELNDFIKEHNLKSMMPRVQEKEAEAGTMGIVEFLPIIEIFLGSTVVASGVKELFNIIKEYFEFRKHKVTSANELEKVQIDKNKIELSVESKDGKKINLQFNSFNDEERNHFFETVDKVLSNA